MTPQSIPKLEEIEDMIKQGERVQMSLQRMRDVVFNHQQASMVEPPQQAHYRRTNGYDHETSSNYGDDMKSAGGFAGAVVANLATASRSSWPMPQLQPCRDA
jgi:hypothetical protein